jgi:hypothetical protein
MQRAHDVGGRVSDDLASDGWQATRSRGLVPRVFFLILPFFFLFFFFSLLTLKATNMNMRKTSYVRDKEKGANAGPGLD